MRSILKSFTFTARYSAFVIIGSLGLFTVPVSAASMTSSKLAPCAIAVAGKSMPKNTFKTETIHFKTIKKSDASRANGTTTIFQTGHNGKRLITYTAHYKNGKLNGCKHTGTKVTVQPQNTVVIIGTLVAPTPAPPVAVTPTPTPPPAPATDSTPAATPDQSSSTYTNVDGNTTASPNSDPIGASAQCRDGSYSHSVHRSGTCSGHGGVANWL